MPVKTARIGPIELSPPVVLAPMAGITNYPFRALCRRYGAALFVSEMITARALVEGKFGSLPVVDDDGMVVGIVTEHDFIKVASRLLENLLSTES